MVLLVFQGRHISNHDLCEFFRNMLLPVNGQVHSFRHTKGISELFKKSVWFFKKL